MAWKRGGQWYAWAYVGDRERRQAALGTPSKAMGRELKRMLGILRHRREWCLIRAVMVDGENRLQNACRGSGDTLLIRGQESGSTII